MIYYPSDGAFEGPITASLPQGRMGALLENSLLVKGMIDKVCIGLTGSWSGAMGVLSSRLNAYEISDGNTMLTTNIKLTQNWQPLGVVVRPYASIDTRDLSFNTTNYCSPVERSCSQRLSPSAGEFCNRRYNMPRETPRARAALAMLPSQAASVFAIRRCLWSSNGPSVW